MDRNASPAVTSHQLKQNKSCPDLASLMSQGGKRTATPRVLRPETHASLPSAVSPCILTAASRAPPVQDHLARAHPAQHPGQPQVSRTRRACPLARDSREGVGSGCANAVTSVGWVPEFSLHLRGLSECFPAMFSGRLTNLVMLSILS